MKTMRLRELFDTFQLFEDYCIATDLNIVNGFDTPKDMWDANPTIEFSR
jgi:hypothetical protein